MRIAREVIGVVSILCLVWSGLVAPALADKRVALVIGNGAYQYADRLSNPVTDARRMRDALAKIGFEVLFGEDLDKRALEHKIGLFANAAEDADVALVFFAGHGATFGDTPYVVPIDARFSSLGEMPYELVPLEMLIGELRRARGLRIAILDACRDNAAERNLKRVASRGGEVTRGLGRVKNPEGLILAYSTQYMATAADGDPKGDSPFTAALLNNVATPGLDIKDLFFRVGREVIAATRGAQRPEISVSFYDSYTLVPAPPTVAATPPAAAPQDSARRAWAEIADTTSIPVLEAFIRRFGDTFYGDLARLRIGALKSQQTAVVVPSVVPTTPPHREPSVLDVLAPPPPFHATRPSDPCSGPVTVSLSTSCATPLTAAQERGLQPKDTFKECERCPEMVVVPAGQFTMGSPTTEQGYSEDEGPQHLVTFNRPFAAGKFAVTFDEWDACVADGGCEAVGDAGWGRGRRPATNLSWEQARHYVIWLSRKTGKTYRLLSEAEREYLTRAGTTTPFWWGSSISTQQANYDAAWTYPHGGPKGTSSQKTMPVDSFQPNPWGFYQVHGNIMEWTEDCFHANYNGAPIDGSAWAKNCFSKNAAFPPDQNHVNRGGGWRAYPVSLRSAGRHAFGDSACDNCGLRVARSLEF